MTLPLITGDPVAVEDSEYILKLGALMEKIRTRTLRLSHSAFFKFRTSPKCFIDNKMKDRKQTPAMVYGSLLDCLVFTEEKFEDDFIFDYSKKPSTDEAINFCIDIVNGVSSDIAVLAWKSKQDPIKKENQYSGYIEFLKSAKGKTVYTASQLEKAQRQKKALYRNRSSRWVLDQLTTTQRKLEWQYKGYDWLGYEDGSGNGIQMDLKTTKDARPSKFKYSVRDFGYDEQAWHYNQAAGNYDKEFYWVCIDPNDEISVIHYPKKSLLLIKERIDNRLKMFERCALRDLWHMSLDFWAPYRSAGIYNFDDY